MFKFAYVDDKIVFARVFADDFALVNFFARSDEQGGTFLRVEQTVLRGHAGFEYDKRTSRSAGNVAFVLLVPGEDVAHYAEPLRVGEHFAPVTEQASCGNFELQFRASAIVCRHVYKFAFSRAEFVHYRADVIVGDFNDEVFHRFVALAVNLFEYYLRAGNLKLVAFAAHVLYKYRKVKFASAEHLESVCAVGFFDPHRYVGFYFFEESCS